MTETKAEQDVNWAELRPQLIKIGLEIGPLIVFFIMNAREDIFTDTAWFMGAMVISLVLSWILLKKIAVMPLVTGVVVLIFGALTLILRDDTFIKMKPTIVNTIFAATLLGGLAVNKLPLQKVLGKSIALVEAGWRTLSLRWGLFFILLALLNEIVWRTQSEEFWVGFKVFGLIGLTVLFSISQVPLIARHRIEKD